MQESSVRSLCKSLTWRMIGTPLTFVLVLMLTGNKELASYAAGTEAVLKTLGYFLHERIWNVSAFGRTTSASAQNSSFVVWFTGLPSAGKTTVAEHLAQMFQGRGQNVQRLDGDAVREVVGAQGFSAQERNRHVRYMGFVASSLEKNGIPVVASFVSPYRASRDFCRSICKNFVEVYVATPPEECEARDVKGLYQRARKNEIQGFTGVDDPYEPPLNAELTLLTAGKTPEQSADEVMNFLRSRGFVG